MNSSIRFVHTTVPDRNSAQNLARDLVEGNYAACVSVESEVESYYVWEGNLQVEAEIPLLIKTQQVQVESVKEFLEEHHPYDCPEILVTEITEANNDYEQWVNDQTDSVTE